MFSVLFKSPILSLLSTIPLFNQEINHKHLVPQRVDLMAAVPIFGIIRALPHPSTMHPLLSLPHSLPDGLLSIVNSDPQVTLESFPLLYSPRL